MLLPIITSKTNHRELQHIYHGIHEISSVTKIIITEGSPTPHEWINNSVKAATVFIHQTNTASFVSLLLVVIFFF